MLLPGINYHCKSQIQNFKHPRKQSSNHLKSESIDSHKNVKSLHDSECHFMFCLFMCWYDLLINNDELAGNYYCIGESC